MLDIQRTFAAGEVDPALWARADVTRYHASAKTVRNFRVLPQGGVSARTGLQYRATTKTVSARIIPFNVTDDDAYVIEVNAGTFRFLKNGVPVETSPGVPYELANPYTAAEVAAMRWVQSVDVLFIVTGSSQPRRLTRYGDTDWRLTIHPTGPSSTAPDNILSSYTTDAQIVEYKITAVGIDGIESRPSFGGPITAATLDASAGPWVITSAGHGLSTGMEIYLPDRAAVGSIEYYTISVIDANSFSLNGTTADPPRSGAVNYVKSHFSVFNAKTPDATHPFALSWSYSAGAAYYNVYRRDNGIWGLIGSTYVQNFVDNGRSLDSSIKPPENYDQADVLGYPGTIALIHQRLVYGAWSRDQEAVAFTPVGNFYTLNPGLNSGDAFSFSVAGNSASRSRHVVAAGNKVVLLTSGSEWSIAGDSAGTITPTQINARQQSEYGSSTTAPSVVGSSIISVSRSSEAILEHKYTFGDVALETRDLSIWSQHLFKGITVDSMAYNADVRVLWAVRSDGILLGLTYLPEQEVWGWHRHDTEGSFRDVVVVFEGGKSRTYVTVDRVINGSTVRYIERFASEQYDYDPTNSRQLDSYIVSTAGTATVSGLAHLNGKYVNALVDGGVQGPFLVSGGSITLGRAGSVAVVGLPYVASLKTLGIDKSNAETLIDAKKNIFKVKLNVARTSGFQAGSDENNLEESPITISEGFGLAEALRDGVMEVNMRGTWDDDGSVVIQQAKPLPLTVLSVAPIYRVGGA